MTEKQVYLIKSLALGGLAELNREIDTTEEILSELRLIFKELETMIKKQEEVND